MVWAVLFWTLFGVVAFAFALAWQMRVLIGVIVARALRARNTTLSIPDSRLAMVKAGNGETGSPEVDHIHATYADQVRQLRRARRVSVVAPVLIVTLLLVGRYFGKV